MARRKARRPAVDRPTNGPSGFSAGEPRDRDATKDACLPYRLPELIEAVGAKRTVFIVEGEAKADALWALGIAATTNLGGAGKWQPEFSEHLRGADILLLPDNDEPGWRHVNEIGIALTGIAARIRVVALPGLPPKGDVCDWLETGGTREQLDALVDEQRNGLSRRLMRGRRGQGQGSRRREGADRRTRPMNAAGHRFTRRRQAGERTIGHPRGTIDDELTLAAPGRLRKRGNRPHWSLDC